MPDFKGTATESAVGFGEESTFNVAATLTDFIAVRRAEYFHTTNARIRQSALGIVLPTWSGYGEPQVGFSYETDLFAEGLELPYKYGLGRHRQSTENDSTNSKYTHTFRVSRHVSDYLTSPDTSGEGLTVGFYHGNLNEVAGRYTRLRGFVPSRTQVRVGRDAATLSQSGIFMSHDDLLVPPAVALNSARLFSPTRTNISFADSTTGVKGSNVHWPMVEATANFETPIAHAYGMTHSILNDYRTPEEPHRSGGIRCHGTFSVISDDEDASMTDTGKSFRTVMDTHQPFHWYFQLFGEAIGNITGTSGKRALQVQFDYCHLTDYRNRLDGYGRIIHSCTWEAFVPPSGFTPTSLCYLEAVNSRSGFGIRDFAS